MRRPADGGKGACGGKGVYGGKPADGGKGGGKGAYAGQPAGGGKPADGGPRGLAGLHPGDCRVKWAAEAAAADAAAQPGPPQQFEIGTPAASAAASPSAASSAWGSWQRLPEGRRWGSDFGSDAADGI